MGWASASVHASTSAGMMTTSRYSLAPPTGLPTISLSSFAWILASTARSVFWIAPALVRFTCLTASSRSWPLPPPPPPWEQCSS